MRGLGCVAHALQAGEPEGPGARAAGGEEAPAARPGAPASLDEAASTGAPAADSAARALAGGVGFSGQLGVFGVPDLLEFLRGARRTGVLVCRSDDGVGSLRFHEGWIAGGEAPSVPRLGELLCRSGEVAPAALEAVAAGGQPGDRALGARLVAAGAASAAAVEAALREQIDRAVRVLIHWREGEFAFNHEDPCAEGDGLDVQVDGQAALLGAFKELDEAGRDGRAP
jgi:hypothetical protein